MCRYSLGYFDYTIGNVKGASTFTELLRIIGTADESIRTLYYQYTRTSNFGEQGYARIDHVYKLEGGMFFQSVPGQGTSLTRSFAPVPGISKLRLGASSDMNMGAPLPDSGFSTKYTIEQVRFIPYGAQVVNLNHKNLVAFVYRERDRICVHSPDTVRSSGLRFPSYGLRIEETETRGSDSDSDICHRHILNGKEHCARVSVTLLIGNESSSVFVESLLNTSVWLGVHGLSAGEELWFYNHSDSGSGRDLVPGYIASNILECLKGSSSCMDLADYSINNWPQVGTGYPIAISAVADSYAGVSVKLILLCTCHTRSNESEGPV